MLKMCKESQTDEWIIGGIDCRIACDQTTRRKNQTKLIRSELNKWQSWARAQSAERVKMREALSWDGVNKKQDKSWIVGASYKDIEWRHKIRN